MELQNEACDSCLEASLSSQQEFTSQLEQNLI